MKKRAISLTLDADVIVAIQREAEMRQISASAYTNEALQQRTLFDDARRLNLALADPGLDAERIEFANMVEADLNTRQEI